MLFSAALLLVQAAAVSGTDATTHLRYERALLLPANAAGPVCAVLDTEAFAHTASRSGDDFRVFREAAAGPLETPFTLTESGAEPAEAQSAAVQHVAVHGDTLAFDLAMPHQAYTAVELQLAANNFVAAATVSGSDGFGERSTPLGVFTLFDFTNEHLARSTELPLQESRFALLHVVLRLRGVTPTVAMLTGAMVPPSREAQTLHTVVAATGNLARGGVGGATVATLQVPGHVPVEGVRIVLDPAWKGDLLRGVVVEGRSKDDVHEVVEGEVWRVTRAPAVDGTPAIEASKLSVDAVLGVNLRSPAMVTVRLKNGDQPPLPVRAIQLEMRQRMFCFDAAANARYTLRYGDAGLHAPVYSEDTLRDAVAKPLIVSLGPETINPAYTARPTVWRLGEGRPEMFWIGLLAMVTLGGSLALHRVRQERKSG